jgi:hypothetical protein
LKLEEGQDVGENETLLDHLVRQTSGTLCHILRWEHELNQFFRSCGLEG